MEEHEKFESRTSLSFNDRRVPWVGLTCVGGSLRGKARVFHHKESVRPTDLGGLRTEDCYLAEEMPFSL